MKRIPASAVHEKPQRSLACLQSCWHVLLVFAAGMSTLDAQNPFVPKDSALLDPMPLAETDRQSSVSTDTAIVGRDNRVRPEDTTSFPYRAIGELLLTFPGGVGSCTGTLIGPQHVLTAAHCVYNQKEKQIVEHVHFIPGRDGSRHPYGIHAATHLFFLEEYKSGDNISNNPDFAVIRLDSAIGKSLGYLGYKPYEQSGTVWQAYVDAHSRAERQSNGNEGVYKSLMTDWVHAAATRYSAEALTYFGYSSDTNSEPWGDRCIAAEAVDIPNERFPQIIEFCDSQRGSSGSGYFDRNHVIRAVASWHRGSESSAIRDSSGEATGDYAGQFRDVLNVGVALSPYSVRLISDWKRGKKPKGTSEVRFPKSDVRQIGIDVDCDEEVRLALRTRNSRGKWETEGFFTLSGEQKLIKSTRSEYVYYHAFSESGEWSGSDGQFDLLGKRLGFRKLEIDQPFRRNITLTCR